MRRPMPTSRATQLRAVGRIVSLATALAIAVAAAIPVAAHGISPAEPPSVTSLLLGWTFEPLPTIGIAVALLLWRWAVRRVNGVHPGNRVPRSRTVAFVAGMAAIAMALLSGIDRYDTSLFSVHMVQHVLLTLVAAPLIALSGPITLALRVASPTTRRRILLPILHARLTRILAFPVVAWLLLATVMWVTHFSALFDAALEDPLIHDLEHGLYLGAALLFWWPAVARDPAPWRMTHPVRAMYTFLQMSQNTFLAVTLLNVQEVLYHHYATLARSWGLPPLADQQLAAGIMWVTGDLIFLAAIMTILVGWSRAEGRDAARADRQAAAELTDIRVREARLAERLTHEREEAQPGSGVPR